MVHRASACVSLLLLLTGCGADVQRTLDKVQSKIEPIVTGLESYRDGHETYPDALDSLVDEGLLESIPVLPEVSGTYGSFPLRYQLSPDRSFYCLSFAYDFPNGIGPPEIVTRYYLSDERKWDTASFPPSFQSLVADRAGKTFRETGSYEALKTTVDYLVEANSHGTGCVNLFKSNVCDSLGTGEECEIAERHQSPGDTDCLRYSPNDKSKPSFAFAFRKKAMPGMGAGGTISDRDFEVVRAVYAVEYTSVGILDWRIVAECD